MKEKPYIILFIDLISLNRSKGGEGIREGGACGTSIYSERERERDFCGLDHGLANREKKEIEESDRICISFKFFFC